MSIDEDPIIGRFFDTPDKKAKWILRIKIAYIIWMAFLTIGIVVLLLILI